MTFNNHYKRQPDKGTVNNKPSLTVPDQSMTIREIINRSQKGLPVSGVRVPMYNETDDGIMPDLSRMDISEIYTLKQQLKKRESEIRKKLEEDQFNEQQRQTEEYYKKKFGKTITDKTNADEITPTEEVK